MEDARELHKRIQRLQKEADAHFNDAIAHTETMDGILRKRSVKLDEARLIMAEAQSLNQDYREEMQKARNSEVLGNKARRQADRLLKKYYEMFGKAE